MTGDVPNCINSNRYLEMVQNLASNPAVKVTATPTLRINGQDYEWSKPEDLVAKVKELVGDVPGLSAAPAAPVPPAAPPPLPPPRDRRGAQYRAVGADAGGSGPRRG